MSLHPISRKSVAERLGGMKVVVSCTTDETSVAISGSLKTQDQLAALIETLEVMREWLASGDAQ